MASNPFETDELERLLGQLPEREVPAGLQTRIMAEIGATHRPLSLTERIRRRLRFFTLSDLHPLKSAAALAMLVAAFWLGTLTSSGKQFPATASRPADSNIQPFANSAQANFLVGRGLLEAGEKQLALEFFQQAVLQQPQSAAYSHWQGVAYWQIGDRENERWSYQQTIARQPDYLPARLNLGHNLLESGDYQGALHQYDMVLQLNPYEQTALYNRALSYRQMQDRSGERQAFIRYLNQYRSDKWAYRAVEHLQGLGNFDYRICPIGNRKVVINQQILLDPDQPARRLELERLARWLEKTAGGELHLVVYCQGNKEKSKMIAEDLRHQLLAVMGKEIMIPIQASWFDEPALIKTAQGSEYELPQGLLVFTRPLTTKRGNA